jgi:UDP-3-O-[3-hydroxymyristoyl] glucosamine N-acyltransferase LpxD
MLRAALKEGEIRRVIGLPDGGSRSIDGIAPLDCAHDRCLYFVNREVSEATRASLAERRGSIAIVPRGSATAGAWGECLPLEASDPRAAIASLLQFVRAERRQLLLVAERRIAPSATISPLAVVDGAVEIGDDVLIEPFCVIGPDVRIGRGSIIRSGVRLFPGVTIGEESVIGCNTVVGHDGYGFVRDDGENKARIAHLGGVIIGSRAEVGVLTLVQAGVITPTVIEDHAKVGDHIAVGHGVRIGRGASVTGGVVIGGSAVIGPEAWVGLNATIREGRRVGSHSLVGMDASVQDDLLGEFVARAPRAATAPRRDDDHDSIGFPQR